ncbi:MAG TPA: RNA methyltransferase [Actinomycetota bacterium]|nr:RNA methyltransferase [Actinomycetota bacterium]
MRDRSREFLVEGINGIDAALDAGIGLDLLFVSDPASGPGSGSCSGSCSGGVRPGFAGPLGDLVEKAKSARVPVLDVSPPVMHAISDADTPPGAIAIAPFVDVDPAELLDRGSDLTVVLAEVRDPGNLGTILRTSGAAGVGAVFLTTGTVDVYNPKVVRASAGAMFHVSVAREVAVPWILAELGDRNVLRVAADPTATVTYDEVDMRGPSALVLGNEAWGLAEEVAAAVDERASIPMRASTESLNVGIAAGVFLFEAVRQRRSL